ncbi:MAG: HYR domain-containing protein, partial [bacterium]
NVSNTDGTWNDNAKYHAAGSGSNTFMFRPQIVDSGYYDIYTCWTAGTNRATNARYKIKYYNFQTGEYVETTVGSVDQQQSPDDLLYQGHWWEYLGQFFLEAGTGNYMQLTDEANGFVIADAVLFQFYDPNPEVFCQDITLDLIDTGYVSITGDQVCNGSNGFYGELTLDVIPSEFTCNDVGSNNVLLTGTDIYDNSAQCMAIVTVKDTILPTVVCHDIIINLDTTGVASIIADDINNGSNDNCGISTMTASPLTFSCMEIGANTVELTVKDTSGNVSTCSATVTVQDTSAPSIMCPAGLIIVQTGSLPPVVDLGEPIVTDNCDGDVTVSNNSPDIFPVGTTTVIWTATDDSGNYISCNQMVTVINDSVNDIDGDGICGDIDNCPTVPNVDQADVNNDGFGDECVCPNAIIDPTAVIGKNPVIGCGTEIKKGVVIDDNPHIGSNVIMDKESNIGDNFVVGDGSKINKEVFIGDDVIIGANVWIGKEVEIMGITSIGSGCIIKKEVVIEQGVSIGDYVTIEEETHIYENTIVPDGATVE